jgi:hypothetical protein
MHAVAKEVVAACVELSAIRNRYADCYSSRLEPTKTKAMVAAEVTATVNLHFCIQEAAKKQKSASHCCLNNTEPMKNTALLPVRKEEALNDSTTAAEKLTEQRTIRGVHQQAKEKSLLQDFVEKMMRHRNTIDSAWPSSLVRCY